MDELEKLTIRTKLIQVFTGKREEWKRFKVKLLAALEEADLLETLESTMGRGKAPREAQQEALAKCGTRTTVRFTLN